jgi:hypothetical protein
VLGAEEAAAATTPLAAVVPEELAVDSEPPPLVLSPPPLVLSPPPQAYKNTAKSMISNCFMEPSPAGIAFILGYIHNLTETYMIYQGFTLIVKFNY